MLITLERQALDRYEVIPSQGGYPITVEQRREAPKAHVFDVPTLTFRALLKRDVLGVLTREFLSVKQIAERVACAVADVKPLLDELESEKAVEVYVGKLRYRGQGRRYYRRQA